MGLPDEDKSLAKTIDKGSVRKEWLISDQVGIAHQRKKPALMLFTATEEGTRCVACKGRKATFLKVKAVWLFQVIT